MQEPPVPPQYADFPARKEALLAHIDALDKTNASNRRLREFIASARPAKPHKVEEKFEAVCRHLGLPWDGRMKEVLEAWEQLRNSLAHGEFREDESVTEPVIKEDTHAESRIAGGFNAILLKFFGYAGVYNPSVSEPGFAQM